MKNTLTPAILLAAFCFLLAVNVTNAQTIRLQEISLNSTISGNSFGVQRNISAGFLIGRRLQLSAGPVFDRGFRKNTGVLLNASYFLVQSYESYNGHFKLSAVVTLERLYNQSLCKNIVTLEERMAFNMKNDESTDFSSMRYKGWEASAGIGCAYRFGFGMILRGDIGLSFYTTSHGTIPGLDVFHDETGTSLRLGFGIGWSLNGKLIPKVSGDAPVVKVRCIK
jgi:hypothetical protein